MLTQEDKQLLLKDLCARLPYDVKVEVQFEDNGLIKNCVDVLNVINLHMFMLGGGYYENGHLYKKPQYSLRPYLRPMSNMTEEEKSYCRNLIEHSYNDYDGTNTACVIQDEISNYVDYLNSHYLDWRGLIEKGLALEAPEGMYKTE